MYYDTDTNIITPLSDIGCYCLMLIDDSTKFLNGKGEWVVPIGEGDMLKSVYDFDDDGVVDETEKIDGGTFV